jgi:hypothetical protein
MRTPELFESERRKRELEESYETKKRYLDEALKEVSVWKKRRSPQLGRPYRQIVMVIRTPSIGCYRYPK